MKTAVIALLVLVVAGGGYYWYTTQTPADEVMEEASNDENSASQGKLNINVICEGALAYMTFPEGESAEQFVAECKAGEHPEVIEQYKEQMGYNDDRAI